jgi:ABC-type sugar transport system ATPase subunit
MADSLPYLIEAQNITKIFGTTKVLDGVSFTLMPGQIHCLCGENGAGKSTLIKILSGAYAPDEGVVCIEGAPYPGLTPLIAKEKGVEVIHQENILVQELTVAENIYTDIRYRTAGFFSMRKTCEAARQLMDETGISLDPYVKVAKLSAAEQQFVKILKALAPDPKVLIMDEPTAMFNINDTELVLGLVKRLSANGKGIIYISHHLEELTKIADTVTVLRDGQLISTCDTKVSGVDLNRITTDMIGRPVELFYAREEKAEIGDVFFEVRDFRLNEEDEPISVSLRKGEILGITGMVGSGRSEIIRSIFGLDRRYSGVIWKDGKQITIETPEDSIRNGIGFVSEDRQKSGLLLPLSILVNTTFLSLPQKRGFIDGGAEMDVTEEMIGALDVRTDSMFKAAGMLSGGNQQKVIVGKWLHKGFDILILDEPTKGIDVNAKSEIYKLLQRLTAQGKALIMVSSDTPEVISLCDRVLVVKKGKVVGEFSGSEITEENVIKAALEVR